MRTLLAVFALLTLPVVPAHGGPHQIPAPAGLEARVGVEHGLWDEAALSADGRRVAVDPGEIKVFTERDGETYVGGEPRPGPVRVLDLRSLEVLAELSLPKGAEVVDLAFGGERVAGMLDVDSGDVVRIWAADTGELLHELAAPRSAHRVVLSADGSRLLVAGSQLLSIDTQSGQVTGRKSGPSVLAVDATGSRCLVTSGVGGASSVDCASLGRAVPAPTQELVLAGAFTGDGRAVVSTDAWEVVWFDATSGADLQRVQRRDGFDPHELGNGRDGRVWVVQDGPHGDQVCAWMPEPTHCVPSPWTAIEIVEPPPSEASSSAPPSPVILSYDGVAPGVPARSMDVPSRLQAVRVHADQATVVSTHGLVLRWDLKTGQAKPPVTPEDNAELGQLWFPDLPPAQAQALRSWPPQGYLVLPLRGRNTLILPGADPTLLDAQGAVLARFDDEVWMDDDLAVSPDGGTLAVLAYDQPMRLVDLSTGKVTRNLGHPNARAPAWSPDGKTLAVWKGRDKVLLLDARSGKVERTLEGNLIRDLAWTPDGRWLVAAGAEGQVWVWDGEGKEQVHQFRAQDTVDLLTFDPRGALVTVGAGEVRVWSTASIRRGRAGE